MFINSNRGYTRDGQQRAAGRFLIVFAHNSHKWEEQNNHSHPELAGQWFDVATGAGFTVQKPCTCSEQSYSLKYCPVHTGEYKRCELSGRTLYAHVCYVSMRQLGHFMMGESKTLQVNKAYGEHPAPNNLILSGTYGGDGLPCDYEDLTETSRAKLIQVPEDLTAAFWAGGGHNSAGSEGQAMHDWAVKTFPAKGGKRAR